MRSVRTTVPVESEMLLRAPASLEAWVRYFGQVEIPVQERTARALDRIGRDQDRADIHEIADVVLSDPLMTLRLLVHLARNRPSRLVTDAETITSALLLLGIGPFFRQFSDLITVESQLCERPAALTGLDQVLHRAHRAARFAAGFALLRKDSDAEIIHQAALLHEFAEALVWCQAPGLALDIQARLRRDPALRPATVQRDVLHIELMDLQLALMRLWRLPDLLQWVSDERHSERPQVRNVALATSLARHTPGNWDNPALVDDVAAVAHLLNVSPEFAQRKVQELNAE